MSEEPTPRLRVQSSQGTQTFDPGTVVTIGRHPDNLVRCESPYVGRRHAEARVEDGGWVLIDLDSKRGLRVGGERAGRVPIAGETRVRLGDDVGGEDLVLAPERDRVSAQSLPYRSQRTDPSAPGSALPRSISDAPGRSREVVHDITGPRIGIGEVTVRCAGSARTFAPARVVTIGREDRNDIVVADPRVSRRHARLVPTASGWVLEDAGSARGVWVAGQRVERAPVERRLRASLAAATGTALDITVGTQRPGQVTAAPLSRATRVGAAMAGALLVVAFGWWLMDSGGTRADPGGSRVADTGVGSGAGGGSGGGSTGLTQAQLDDLALATVYIEGSSTGFDGEPTAWSGSGTIIDPSGLILTNAHVAERNAPGLAAQYVDPFMGVGDDTVLSIGIVDDPEQPPELRYRGEVLAADGWLDLAIVRITSTLQGLPAPGLDLPTVEIADSRDVRRGHFVGVLGFPGLTGGGATQVAYAGGEVNNVEADERARTDRGMINVGARITGGNSGGLAVNAAGHMIGVPTASATDGRTPATVGRIRPVHLAEPLIEAVAEGRDYVTPFTVLGAGTEAFAEDSWKDSATAACDGQSTTYPSGTAELFAAVSLTGMTAGTDVLYVWQGQTAGEPIAVRSLETWESDSTCVVRSLTARTTLPDGRYELAVFAGPTLRFLGSTATSVGGAGTGAGTDGTGETDDGDGDGDGDGGVGGLDLGIVPGEMCPDLPIESWTMGAGVVLGKVEIRGEELLEGGPVTLVRRYGQPYESRAQANADAIATMDYYGYEGAARKRWIVLEHGGSYHLFEGVVHRATTWDARGNTVLPTGETPPCLLPPGHGTVVGWHGAAFFSEFLGGPHQWWRYQWTVDGPASGEVFINDIFQDR